MIPSLPGCFSLLPAKRSQQGDRREEEERERAEGVVTTETRREIKVGDESAEIKIVMTKERFKEECKESILSSEGVEG